MNIPDNIAKQLFITVFYGAVLGNYIAMPFGVVIDYFITGKEANFMLNEGKIIAIKLLLFISITLFFSFEYLFSLNNPEYKYYFLAADFTILIFGAMSLKKINLENGEIPAYKHIALYFAFIMLIHTVWSIVFRAIWNHRNKDTDWKGEDPSEKINYYGWVSLVAGLLFLIFMVLFFLVKFFDIKEQSIAHPLWVIIGLSVVAYFKAMRKRGFL